MANENNNNNNNISKKVSNELVQLLICVAVTGIFLLIEVWLIFYYAQGFVFTLIFGVLIILMVCLLTLNIYQIFIKHTAASGSSDKKAEYLIYKQVKSLPDVFERRLTEEIKELSEGFGKMQKKTAKAVLIKVEEQLAQLKTEEDSSDVDDKLDGMKDEISGLKALIDELKTQNENLTNQLRSALMDHETIKDSFSDLKREHKKVFDLLGSLAFRNDEIKEMVDAIIDKEDIKIEDSIKSQESSEQENGTAPETQDDVQAAETPQETVTEEAENIEELISNISKADDYDPNKQLSPDEIADIFASLNN